MLTFKQFLTEAEKSSIFKQLLSNTKTMNHDDFVEHHSVQQKNMKIRRYPPHDIVPLHKIDPTELDKWDDHKKWHSDHLIRVNSIRETLRKNPAKVPPLFIEGHQHDKLRPAVLDGHHRYIAHMLEGHSHAPVWFDNNTLSKIWKDSNK